MPAQTGALATQDVVQPREIITDAEPILPLVMPVYPASALRVRHTGAVVAVHVVVGSTGSVREVSPSMIGFSSAGPFEKEFRAAVEAAVWRWRFQPAEAQQTEPVALPDGRILRKVIRREPVEATFDVAFTFTSSGDVLPARAR
ncbi:MAG TPA: hypothetical protein VHO24_11570 [Opitutaceae bacterium]|nr:hypothetical protein [Opitutaceae bacterium]